MEPRKGEGEKWTNGKFRKKKIRISSFPMIFRFYQHTEKNTRDPTTFFCMININKMAAIFQFFYNGQRWYSVSVNTRKTRDPNFGGVGNLKFFHMIDINKMAAIFQFFHNGWHWYSISVDTWKTGDPNFGGVGNLKSFHTIDINKMAAICQIFHNGQCWYSVSIDTRKTGDVNFPSIQFSDLFCWFSFPCHPFLGSVSTLMCGYT